MLTTVWFSTALRKLIFLVRSSADVPNASCNAIVVDKASDCSTDPRTARRVASVTCAIRSAPILPLAAASAASFIVSTTATPYFVNSSASSLIFSRAAFVSSVVVNISP